MSHKIKLCSTYIIHACVLAFFPKRKAKLLGPGAVPGRESFQNLKIKINK